MALSCRLRGYDRAEEFCALTPGQLENGEIVIGQVSFFLPAFVTYHHQLNVPLFSIGFIIEATNMGSLFLWCSRPLAK